MRATLLRRDLNNYNEQAAKYLPSVCPRCHVEGHLILDNEDINYAFCWNHFGEVYIGPYRPPIKEHDRGGVAIDREKSRKSKLIND